MLTNQHVDVKLSKKNFLIIIAVIIIIAIVFIGILWNSTKSKIIEVDNVNELVNIVDKSETSFIYIARPTCADCRSFYPILEEVLADKSLNVYYFNTDKAKDDDGYDDIISSFDVVWVPAFYKVQDGAIYETFPLNFENTTNEEKIKECKEQIEKFIS